MSDDCDAMYRAGVARRNPMSAPRGGGYSNGGRVAKAAYQRTPEGGAQDMKADASIARQRGLSHAQVEKTSADELHHEAGLKRGGRVKGKR